MGILENRASGAHEIAGRYKIGRGSFLAFSVIVELLLLNSTLKNPPA